MNYLLTVHYLWKSRAALRSQQANWGPSVNTAKCVSAMCRSEISTLRSSTCVGCAKLWPKHRSTMKCTWWRSTRARTNANSAAVNLSRRRLCAHTSKFTRRSPTSRTSAPGASSSLPASRRSLHTSVISFPASTASRRLRATRPLRFTAARLTLTARRLSATFAWSTSWNAMP